MNRAAFLKILGTCSLAVLGLQSMLSTLRFAKATVSYGPARKRVLGDPARFGLGAPILVEDAQLFVFRDSEGLRAMASACTHLGCNVRQDRTTGGFVCPCHGSRYNAQGQVTAGPAPASLPFYRLSLDKKGRLIVDLGEQVDAAARLRTA